MAAGGTGCAPGFGGTPPQCARCPVDTANPTQGGICTPCNIPSETTDGLNGQKACGKEINEMSFPFLSDWFFTNGLENRKQGFQHVQHVFSVCSKGYGGSEGNCVECPVGEYKTSSGNQPCTPCGTDATTMSTGSTAKRDCGMKLYNLLSGSFFYRLRLSLTSISLFHRLQQVSAEVSDQLKPIPLRTGQL